MFATELPLSRDTFLMWKGHSCPKLDNHSVAVCFPTVLFPHGFVHFLTIVFLLSSKTGTVHSRKAGHQVFRLVNSLCTSFHFLSFHFHTPGKRHQQILRQNNQAQDQLWFQIRLFTKTKAWNI